MELSLNIPALKLVSVFVLLFLSEVMEPLLVTPLVAELTTPMLHLAHQIHTALTLVLLEETNVELNVKLFVMLICSLARVQMPCTTMQLNAKLSAPSIHPILEYKAAETLLIVDSIMPVWPF